MKFKNKIKQKAIDYNFMSKNGMCTRKNKTQKREMHTKQTILH